MSEQRKDRANLWETRPYPKDGKVKGVSGEVIAVDEAAHSVDVAESYRRVRELEGSQQPVVPCDHVNVEVKLAEADKPNLNGRVYPGEVVKEQVRHWRQEYLQQPSHVRLEAGKDLPVYNQRGEKLADARLEGCGRLVVYGKEEVGHLIHHWHETNGEFIGMSKGDEADLFNEEGTGRMGRVIYDGCGVFRLKEDPNDIRLGDWLWALALAHTGDPQVVYAEVRAIWTEQRKGREPVIEVNLFTKAGVLVYGRREHIFPTKAEAEAARMKILEEGL